MKFYMRVPKNVEYKRETKISDILNDTKRTSVIAFGSTKEEVKDYLKVGGYSGVSKLKIVKVEVNDNDIIKIMQMLASNLSSNEMKSNVKVTLTERESEKLPIYDALGM